jgi:hypothetical protein
VRPRAQRQLSTRIVSVIRFTTNTLASTPRVVAKPGASVYRTEEQAHAVVVLYVSHRSDTYGT